jgi:hypothetical protein
MVIVIIDIREMTIAADLSFYVVSTSSFDVSPTYEWLILAEAETAHTGT